MIETPYATFTTTEVINARSSLTELLSRACVHPAHHDAIGDFVVWATIELAERLTNLVTVNDEVSFGAALEALAYDAGIRPEHVPRRHSTRDVSLPSAPRVIVVRNGREEVLR